MSIVERTIEVDGKSITLQTGKIAKQANGSVLVSCGGTVVLVTAVGAKEPMGVVFDNPNTAVVRKRTDGIHFASDAAVMNGDYDFRSWADEPLETGLVQVQRIIAYVGEDRTGAPHHEGIGSRNEGETRHDNFVAGCHIEKQRRHLERMSARRRKEDARHIHELF